MNESAIKTKIRKYLKDEGYFIPYNPHFGKSGVPDILGCMYGKFIAIEVKQERGLLTALQAHEIDEIRNKGGGHAIVVYGYDDFKEKFNKTKEVISDGRT